MAKETTVQTETTPDAMTMLAQAVAMLAQMQQQPAQSANTELMEKLTLAMNRMADTQEQGAKLVALETKRAHRPSNEIAHKRSAYDLRGFYDGSSLEKPKLKCPTFAPWTLEDDTLTREEVELVNLLEPGDYTIRRTDDTLAKFTVRVQTAIDGKTITRMSIGNDDQSLSQDNFQRMPRFADWMRQMLAQHSADVKKKAKAVLTMDEEAALIEAHELSVAE